jgi:hypothetical protein
MKILKVDTIAVYAGLAFKTNPWDLIHPPMRLPKQNLNGNFELVFL